jgi:hypothetical protein
VTCASTCAVAIAVSVAATLHAQPSSPDSLRLIVATGATCHTLPDPGSPIAERYHLGDVVGASKSAKGLGGRTWYFDSWRVKGISPTCWVPANATVPFSREHPEAGFAAIADHVLARGDSSSFETLVEAENFLIEPNPYAGVGQSPLATSGLLQFRRLQLIDRASRVVTAFRVQDAPLEGAWILAHRDVLGFSEPDAMWFVPNEHLWKLYDANAGTPWAEELAWYAAQRIPPSDECGADCFLGMIGYGPQQYWTRLPNGRSIDKVLALATRLADMAIGGISEQPPTRVAIDGVRSSLARVGAPGKQALLDRLALLDRAVKP